MGRPSLQNKRQAIGGAAQGTPFEAAPFWEKAAAGIGDGARDAGHAFDQEGASGG